MSLATVKIISEDIQGISLARIQELTTLVFNSDCALTSRNLERLPSWSPSVVGHIVSSGISNVVDRIVLDAAARSERTCLASADLCLRLTISKAEEVLQSWLVEPNRKSTSRLIQDSFGDILERVPKATKALTGSSLQNLIGQLSWDPVVTAISSDVIGLAGLSSKISVEVMDIDRHTVEAKRGFSFQIESPLSTTLGKWSRGQARFLLVDGILESLSEISVLLDEARERSRPLVLVCRGVLPDLLSVLEVNNRMGLIDVAPVVVRFDEIGANVIKDMAVVLGCDVISATKGNLVSSSRFDDLPSCARVLIQKDRMVLQPKVVGAGFNVHLAELTRRRAELAERGENTDALDARIRTMNSDIVRIKVPTWDASTAFEIEKVTKHVGGVVKAGGVRLSDLLLDFKPAVLKKHLNIHFPTHGVISALRCASKACESLLGLGSLILLD